MDKPLYQRITEDLESAITSGRWKPGDRIPFEQELTQQYGCSRMTVNKAISTLVDKGMVVRRRKAGSFVAAPALELAVLQIQDISEEIARAGHRHRFQMLRQELDSLSHDEAARLGEPVGERVLRIECLHFADDLPQSLERRVIMLRSVPQAETMTFDTNPPGAWLLEQAPWTEARHVIRAVRADAAIAMQLEIDKAAPCLVLIRQTWQQGHTVTYLEMTYAADRYQFAGAFRSERGL